jgi:hypothetical protein|tara:strand:+ start:737 stop:883 length:147 start_codon:yes stop_codon:yes gene_type:complete
MKIKLIGFTPEQEKKFWTEADQLEQELREEEALLAQRDEEQFMEEGLQ